MKTQNYWKETSSCSIWINSCWWVWNGRTTWLKWCSRMNSQVPILFLFLWSLHTIIYNVLNCSWFTSLGLLLLLRILGINFCSSCFWHSACMFFPGRVIPLWSPVLTHILISFLSHSDCSLIADCPAGTVLETVKALLWLGRLFKYPRTILPISLNSSSIPSSSSAMALSLDESSTVSY